MFQTSLFLSTIVAVLFGCHAILLNGQKRYAIQFLPWMLALIPGMCVCVFSMGYLLSLLLVFLLTTSCYLISPRKWLLIPVALLSVMIGHLTIYVVYVRPELNKIDEIRALPVADLNERLPSIQTQSYPIHSNAGFELNEDAIRYRPARELELLHNSQIDHFTNAAGFGISRGYRPIDHVEILMPNRRPVSQPGVSFTIDSHGEIEHPITDFKDSITDFNKDAREKFAFPRGWGWQRSPKEVVAFSPHQMGEKSKNEEYDGVPQSKETRWSLRSIQLVGLLLAPKPRVYVTENLPRMDEAKNAPTRELDPFEKAGLDAVGNGDEIYVGRHVSEPILRAVGPLRASQSCIECHHCENGTLLGAFSYTLIQNSK